MAIVGPTGAGKTTLVNLLMRFYELDGGRITFDGIDIRDVTRDDLRRSFGMVLQDTWLFRGSIHDNIAYGAEGGATREQVVAAAQAAHVDRLVRTLPDGYDTILGTDAASVSAGEQQLLTIARAFLADPSVLILDEATSSVDTRTEVLIQRAMADLRAGRTAFVIAHRLSTIRDADLILVLDQGRIIEQGTHEQLIAAGGFYYPYTSQFLESYDGSPMTRPRGSGAATPDLARGARHEPGRDAHVFAPPGAGAVDAVEQHPRGGAPQRVDVLLHHRHRRVNMSARAKSSNPKSATRWCRSSARRGAHSSHGDEVLGGESAVGGSWASSRRRAAASAAGASCRSPPPRRDQRPRPPRPAPRGSPAGVRRRWRSAGSR